MPTPEGLTSQEVLTIVNRYIGVSGGYLGDFSYRTHQDFYVEYAGIDGVNVYAPELENMTTRERFIRILSTRPPREQAAIIRGVVERFPAHDPADSARMRLRDSMIEWAVALDSASAIRVENPAQTRAVVLRALDDATTLMATSGPTSVVDRIHTALHGHLLALCESSKIAVPNEATLAQILRALRRESPALSEMGPRAVDITRVLQATGTILDALNPLRNRASVAHPNEELLDDAEAMLAVNAARTIFVFLDTKLRAAPPIAMVDAGETLTL